MLEFQDLQLAYDQGSIKVPNPAKDKGWRQKNDVVQLALYSDTLQSFRLAAQGKSAGRQPPAPGAIGGNGLWVANQVCDLVQIRSSADGTVVNGTVVNGSVSGDPNVRIIWFTPQDGN